MSDFDDHGGRWNARQWAVDHDRRDEERFTQLRHSISAIGRIMAWFGSILVAVVLGVLGWSLTQQYNAQVRLNDTIQATSDISAAKAAKKVVAEQNGTP